MLLPKTSVEILNKLEAEQLVLKLIEQLNKDFQLANLDERINLKSTVKELKESLVVIVSGLLKYKYDDYLNLLYRIDVSESNIALINEEKNVDVIEKLVYLILRREYQKVWLKQNYSAS